MTPSANARPNSEDGLVVGRIDRLAQRPLRQHGLKPAFDRRRRGARLALQLLLDPGGVNGRRPAEVRLQDLTDVHARRHAQGFSTTSTGVPSGMQGMSSSGRILAMTPLLPWRPAILSPTESFRFMAT